MRPKIQKAFPPYRCPLSALLWSFVFATFGVVSGAASGATVRALTPGLTPHQAAMAQDRLVAACYAAATSSDALGTTDSRNTKSGKAEPKKDDALGGEEAVLVSAAAFPVATLYFEGAGFKNDVCEAMFAIKPELVTSLLAYGPGVKNDVKARPLVAAMQEKLVDLVSSLSDLKSFGSAMQVKRMDVIGGKLADAKARRDILARKKEDRSESDAKYSPLSGVKRIDAGFSLTREFGPMDLEVLLGPAVATASGSVIDGDLYVQAWRLSKRALISSALRAGMISSCLSAKINERIHDGDAWRGQDIIPRLPASRPIFETAARSQHERLINLRNFLVDVAKTVASSPVEAESIRAWIDGVAFGTFIGVNAPGVAVCKRSEGEYESWLANHRMDERLAKMTGYDLAFSARTCDASPLALGGESVGGVSADDLARLKGVAPKGLGAEAMEPRTLSETASAADMADAMRRGEAGMNDLLVSRFHAWSIGRYGTAANENPYRITAGSNDLFTGGLSGARNSIFTVVGKAADIARGLLATTDGTSTGSAKSGSKVPSRPNAVPGADSGSAPSGDQGGGSVDPEAKKNLEMDAERRSAGRVLFLADWTPPKERCDGFFETALGMRCPSEEEDAAYEAKITPDQFIKDTMSRLRQASETYATLVLVLVQEDLAAGDFRNRPDTSFACDQLGGMDDQSLRRHRDSTELTILVDSTELAMTLEKLLKGQELLYSSVVERDFNEMFSFAQKTRRAAGYEDTRRIKKYLREDEAVKNKSR